jgi:UDP-N-acetylmuramoylalanine--D-glutamate ligase
MADLSYLKALGKPIAILGLGVSGAAVARACIDADVPFHAWDDNVERQKEFDAHIYNYTSVLTRYAALVPSAGIKPSHPILKAAHEKGIPILSDVDLLVRSAPGAMVIGVTGTNGKSTSTALIGHILKEAGVKAEVGGNIGRAACSLPGLKEDGVYVLELSSYQLDITASPVCDIAVVTNITADHLEWHGTIERYFASKEKITQLRNDRPHQVTIIGIDSLLSEKLAKELQSSESHEVIQISTKKRTKHIYVTNGILFDQGNQMTDLNAHKFLRGAHNHENIATAYAACRAYGLETDDIIPAIFTFEGLPHRQKNVGHWKQITFIDDSKATNADAARYALASFDRIYWILGGLAKDDGIDNLEDFYPKIKHAFLIGDASKRFAEKLQGHIPFAECGTLEKAVVEAFQLAQADHHASVILLSPACASFDQYKNYMERGDHFIRLAHHEIQKAAA